MNNGSSSRDPPLRFVGKISNLYQPPSYYTSNLIRRLHNHTHVISSRDRTVLDLYGELESMRMRYAPDPFIPQKADLYELSLHELWGHARPNGPKRGHYNPFEPSSPSEAFVNGTELGHNTIAIATEAINEEELFLHAMKVFSHQPKIAHFMLCSTKANVLQEFCWPVDLVHDETTRMEDLFQKRDFFRSTFDNDRIGDTDMDRFLMLSHEVKSFTPILLDGQAVWSENYHIVPRHRAFERILRQPPTVFVEMARNGIQEHVANDGFIAMKRPRLHTNETPTRPEPLITGKDIVRASVSSISIEGMTMRSMPGLKPEEALSSLFAGRSSHERVLAPRSFERAPAIQQSLKEQAFELTIARHLETMLDGLLEAVFQFLLPMLRIAAEDPFPVGTESMGTFKLSSRRPTTTRDSVNEQQEAEGEGEEEKALMAYLSKSAALAIESIRFHGDSATADERDVDNDKNTTGKRRRTLEVGCHREKLYVEYRPSATTTAANDVAATATSSSGRQRRRPTLRQTSTTTAASRTRRLTTTDAAQPAAAAVTSTIPTVDGGGAAGVGGETKTLKVKRRRLHIRCHLWQQDRPTWEQRVRQQQLPKSIIGLRAHLRRLHRLPPPDETATASSVTATEPSPSAVDPTTEYINDDSTTDDDDDEGEEEDVEKDHRRGKKRSSAAPTSRVGGDSRRRSPRKPTATDRESVRATARVAIPTVSAYEQNKQRKHRKRLLPTLVPLPVPLAQIYLPQSSHTRQLLARRMLRWQAGGVMGAGRQTLQWHRPIQTRRRRTTTTTMTAAATRVVQPLRRAKPTSAAAGVKGIGDANEDIDDDNDLSVISAITCDGDDDANGIGNSTGRRSQSFASQQQQQQHRRHLLLDQSSDASLALSSIIAGEDDDDHVNGGDDDVDDVDVNGDDDADAALPPEQQQLQQLLQHRQRSKAKVMVPAPSVPGTLETGYMYHEPYINVHTGQFEDPHRRRQRPSAVGPPATASSSSTRIVNEERQRVNWEHILLVLELIRDIAMGDKPAKTGPGRWTEPIRLRIHPDLPPIPLDDLALTRIRYHLTAVFTNFLREHEVQHQPPLHNDQRHPHVDLAAVPHVIRQPARYPRGRGGSGGGGSGGGSGGRVPPTVAPPSFLLFDHDTVHAIEAGKTPATATAASADGSSGMDVDDELSLSSIEDDSSSDDNGGGDGSDGPFRSTNGTAGEDEGEGDDALPQLALPPAVRFAPPPSTTSAAQQRRTLASTGLGVYVKENDGGDDVVDGGARRGDGQSRDPRVRLQRRQRQVYGYGASSTSLMAVKPPPLQSRQSQQRRGPSTTSTAAAAAAAAATPVAPSRNRQSLNLFTFPRPAVLAAQRLSQRYQDYMQQGALSSSLLASVSRTGAAAAGTKRARASSRQRSMGGPMKRPRYDVGGEDDNGNNDDNDSDEDYEEEDEEDEGDDDDRVTHRPAQRKRPRRGNNPYDRFHTAEEEDNDDDDDDDVDDSDDDDGNVDDDRWPSNLAATSAGAAAAVAFSSSSPTKLARGSSVIPGTTPRAYSSPKKSIIVGPRSTRRSASQPLSGGGGIGGDVVDSGSGSSGDDASSLSPGASVAGSVHEYDFYPPLPSAFAPPPVLSTSDDVQSLPYVKTEPEAPPRRVAMTRSMRQQAANASTTPPTASTAPPPPPPVLPLPTAASSSLRSRSQTAAVAQMNSSFADDTATIATFDSANL